MFRRQISKEITLTIHDLEGYDRSSLPILEKGE